MKARSITADPSPLYKRNQLAARSRCTYPQKPTR